LSLYEDHCVSKTNNQTRPQPDGTRELCETVVVVLVLVSLLRGFVAEAFVIPTGSMATTLYGANKIMTCPQCGHVSRISASEQAEGVLGPDHQPVRITKGVCQNCRFPLSVEPSPLGWLNGELGDRVVVAKYMYEGFREPERWDVPVFKYPAGETEGRSTTRPSKTNFIKRLVGLPGETIVPVYGDVYVRKPGEPDFKIASKPPRAMLGARRLVYDNDKQAKDLNSTGFPSRWHAKDEKSWAPDATGKSFNLSGSGRLAYRHLIGGGERDHDRLSGRSVPPSVSRSPQLITDFEAYNTSDDWFMRNPWHNWVGDLMIEFRADLRKLSGALTLELNEATRKYECVFDLAGKKIRLLQNGEKLAEEESPITSTGGWNLRFANFDDRLVVWVNEELVFGDGQAVKMLTPSENGPTAADLHPVQIGGADVDLAVSRLKLFRDIYYTQHARYSDAGGDLTSNYPFDAENSRTLDEWRDRLREAMEGVLAQARSKDETGDRPFRVPEGCYLMFGDNSPLSSDSREWSMTHYVPRHMLLGRAIVVYWPLEMPPWALKFVH
jgi:signal peptidase I